MGVTLGNIGTLMSLVRKTRLPVFQRDFVWTLTQVEELLDSWQRGFPVGAIILWGNLVLDGQQRLTALTGMRPGGERIHTVCWSFAERRWVANPGGLDQVPEGLWAHEQSSSDLIQMSLDGRISEQDLTAYGNAYDVFRYRTVIPIHEIESDNPADAVEAFRRINSTGTPITAADLALLTA